MRMRDVFKMDEGVRDKFFRDKAQQLFRALGEYIQKNPEPEHMQMSSLGPAGIYRFRDSGNPLLDDLWVAIVAVTGGKKGQQADYTPPETDYGPAMISFYTYHPKFEKMNEQAWRALLPSIVSKMWNSQARSSIVHELTHHIDYHRWKDPETFAATYRRKDAEASIDAGKYYSDPAEMNAFTQQMFDYIDRQIESSDFIDSMKKFKIAFDVKNAEDLFDVILQEMKNKKPLLAKHIIGDFKRRLQKRTYQYWIDLERRFSG